MDVALYDEIRLRDGRTAHIVEVYEPGVAYEADIEIGDGEYETDTILHDEIEKVIHKD